jgi:hypothetical protein
MRFSVPQYITIEDKLLGLITFKQLFLLLGAFLLTYLSSKVLSGIFVFFIFLITFGLAFVLGFIQINGKPVLSSLIIIFSYFFGGRRRYIWKSVIRVQEKTIKLPKIEEYGEVTPTEAPPPITLIQPPPTEEWPTRPERPPTTKAEPLPQEFLTQPLAISGKSLLPKPEMPYNPYRNFPLPKFPKRRW